MADTITTPLVERLRAQAARHREHATGLASAALLEEAAGHIEVVRDAEELAVALPSPLIARDEGWVPEILIEVALAAWDKTRRHLDPTGAIRMRAALAAYEAALWQPIETAPTDGTLCTVYAAPYEGLSGFVTHAAYHPDAGWCVDERRTATHWSPLPPPPKGEFK